MRITVSEEGYLVTFRPQSRFSLKRRLQPHVDRRIDISEKGWDNEISNCNLD
jgi:hypothetical protein